MIKFGYIQSGADACVYTKTTNGQVVSVVSIFVDDVLITGVNDETTMIKNQLKSQCKLSTYLSLKLSLV